MIVVADFDWTGLISFQFFFLMVKKTKYPTSFLHLCYVLVFIFLAADLLLYFIVDRNWGMKTN